MSFRKKGKFRLILLILPGMIAVTDLEGQLHQGNCETIPDKVYKESVRSVLLHRAGWELTYPVIELNTPDRICLSFDDLDSAIRNYSYTLILCDANWCPSSLPAEEYLDGFHVNQLDDYTPSFNTYFNYIHYTLILPNENIRFLVSGNYIIKVFEEFNEDTLVLTKRFAVVEPFTSVKAEVKRPDTQPFRNTGHEINFSVLYGNLDIVDPYSEIQVVVCQNNRWDLALKGLKPVFYREGVLEYNDQMQNILPGGNEYRYFDIKSLRYQSEFIKNIEFIYPYYHIELFPDQPRSGNVYFFHEDLNGRYFIDIQESEKNNTDADYVYVHFTLPSDAPLTDGDVYVFGALTNWSVNEFSKMEYNFERKGYDLTLLLKQGFYNYEYVFVSKHVPVIDALFFEGSHYETENDYVIYVYYRTINSRYDQLVGYQVVNSLRQ